MKFTGHERDFTDGSSPADDLDYMHARFYGPLLGRFLSVDPVLQLNLVVLVRLQFRIAEQRGS